MARQMKVSGVDWIGDLPSDWEVKRGKDIFNRMRLPVKPEDDVVTCFRDGQVVLRNKRRTEGFTIAMHEHGYQGIQKGHLAVHAMDAFAGAIGISEDDGKCSPVITVCSAKKEMHLHFYKYVLRNMATIGYIASLGRGIRERSTDFRHTDIQKTYYIVPTHMEQIAIAAYLDDHITGIDSKIQLLEEKSTALAELRKSVIHQAVTKGLDPDVAMKPSGVDWIGDIPVHWPVLRADFLFTKLKRAQKEKNVLSLSYGRLVNKKIGNDGLTPENYDSYQGIDTNDIVLRLTDLQNDERSVRVAHSSLTGIITSAYLALKTKYVVNSVFGYLLLHSAGDINKIFYSMGGGVRQTMTFNDISRLAFAVPSIEEQESIVAYLDERTSIIDESIKTITEQIAALKDLRKSLIYEAVTGKIDVADFGYVTV